MVVTRGTSRLAAAALLLAASACAKGSGLLPGAGGSGGLAASTSSTSSLSTGGAATTSSSTSSAPACDETPCKLLPPQCGCDTGKQCTLVGTTRKCVKEGTALEGEKCGSGGTPCSPGLLCVTTSSTVSACAKFCASDADCSAPGGLCIQTLGDGAGGSIPDVTLCTENCDPLSGDGCPAGASCQVGQESSGAMRYLTFCAGAGTKQAMATCDPTLDECASGLGCFNTGSQHQCLQYCQYPAGGCSGGLTCNDIMAQVGAIDYGACF